MVTPRLAGAETSGGVGRRGKSTSVLKPAIVSIQPTERNKEEGGFMPEKKNDRKPRKVVKREREKEQKKKWRKKSEAAEKEKQREEFLSHRFNCGLQEVG